MCPTENLHKIGIEMKLLEFTQKYPNEESCIALAKLLFFLP